MLVTSKLVPTKPRIFLGSDEIICKNSVKYLGLNMEKNLKFASHVENISSKIAQFIGIAHKLVALFFLTAARNYYYYCVQTTLIYCITVWGGVINATYRGKKFIKRHDRLVKKTFGKFYEVNC